MFDCKKLKKTEINEDNLYVDKIWFQCENENCLKWRLLSSEDAAQVDRNEPWFCFMNTDPNHNTCSASEECFPEESHVLKRGFKYVYSQFPIGSLVLVKLYSWPSWPGILCLDPLIGKYVTCDLDGNVEHYHVEFLGNPHSRKWIKANSVGHYSITLKPEKCKFDKRWYESALQEAYLLYAFSHEQRLEMCLLSKKGMPLVDKPEANIKAAIKANKRLCPPAAATHSFWVLEPHKPQMHRKSQIPMILLGEKEPEKPLSSPVITFRWHLLLLLPLSYCVGDGGSQGGLGVQASLASAQDVLLLGNTWKSFISLNVNFPLRDYNQFCWVHHYWFYRSSFAIQNIMFQAPCSFIMMKTSKNDNKNKKCSFRKNKRKGFFKYSFEIVCSDDALLKENIVVSETEDILKDLEQMLQEAGEPEKTLGESDARGDEMRAEGKCEATSLGLHFLICKMKLEVELREERSERGCPRHFLKMEYLGGTHLSGKRASRLEAFFKSEKAACHIKIIVSLCNTETSEEILCENQCEEDCLIIDGVPFRTGECIESITDKFKEIDALMSEF
uniref:Zinc finger CW-type PWWP domain protein 2 n=1 Tax=Phascolarctos cinereus TaxID=38626 RepID=A0A6P5KUL8_PHACI|nr:zinc finger CW-type PWWP domain protein 2 [Phascolarctos cinereus]